MKKTLQNNIQEKRLKKGATQEDLACAVKVTRQTIISIEKGNYTPSVTLALSLATFFKTSVEELFWYTK